MRRRLALLTSGRQDFGILRSTIRGLEQDSRFELLLWVGGMHLEARFGTTLDLVAEEGVESVRELAFLSEPPDAPRDAGQALLAVVDAIEGDRPEALVLVGDRSETLAAAVAAAIMRVPVVHLHGGEESEGAIDNVLRHAVTKLSHLHFTTHESHAARVVQMGEDPEHVHVVAPPGVDNLYREDLPPRENLLSEFGLADPGLDPLVLVTIHPTTLSSDAILAETMAVANALDELRGVFVITMPNADVGGDAIREFWLDWVGGREGYHAVSSLGERRYWGLMKAADLMISNSSSGLIEAPSVSLPVVNVGDRQRGRLRHPLTIDVHAESSAIVKGARRAGTTEFRACLRRSDPIYPLGPAWIDILDVLASWEPPSPPRKSFRSMDLGGVA